MSKEYKDTVKFIRHRKLGKYRLYIYKDYMSDMYVLQEEFCPEGKAVKSHNVSYGYDLRPILMAYNRAVKNYNLVHRV